MIFCFLSARSRSAEGGDGRDACVSVSAAPSESFLFAEDDFAMSSLLLQGMVRTFEDIIGVTGTVSGRGRGVLRVIVGNERPATQAWHNPNTGH